MSASDNPSVIHTVTVSTDDVVTAVEAGRNGQPVVLRLTPPFSGRMRARLHVVESGYDADPEPVHLNPLTLLADGAPDYPEPAETEDALRADPAVEYTREHHREYHVKAVKRWREAVRDCIADTVTVDTPDGNLTVQVRTLG